MTTDSMWDAADEVTSAQQAHLAAVAKAAIEPLWPYLSKAASTAEFSLRWDTESDRIERMVATAVSQYGVADPTRLASEARQEWQERHVALIRDHDGQVLASTLAGAQKGAGTLSGTGTQCEVCDGEINYAVGNSGKGNWTHANWNRDVGTHNPHKARPKEASKTSAKTAVSYSGPGHYIVQNTNIVHGPSESHEKAQSLLEANQKTWYGLKGAEVVHLSEAPPVDGHVYLPSQTPDWVTHPRHEAEKTSALTSDLKPGDHVYYKRRGSTFSEEAVVDEVMDAPAPNVVLRFLDGNDTALVWAVDLTKIDKTSAKQAWKDKDSSHATWWCPDCLYEFPNNADADHAPTCPKCGAMGAPNTPPLDGSQGSLQTVAVAWARRHYEDIAETIGGLPDGEREKAAGHFARALSGTNPNYRSEQFRDAASTPGYRVRGGTGTAKYTRGHYQTVADAIRTYPGDKDTLTKAFSDHFSSTNARFKPDTFLKATSSKTAAFGNGTFEVPAGGLRGLLESEIGAMTWMDKADMELTIDGRVYHVGLRLDTATGDDGNPVHGDVSGFYGVSIGDKWTGLGGNQYISPGKPNGPQQAYAARSTVDLIVNNAKWLVPEGEEPFLHKYHVTISTGRYRYASKVSVKHTAALDFVPQGDGRSWMAKDDDDYVVITQGDHNSWTAPGFAWSMRGNYNTTFNDSGLAPTLEQAKADASEAHDRAHARNMGVEASMLKGAPFAGYDDFDACVRANSDKADPQAYCGKIKHQVEDGKKTSSYSDEDKRKIMGPKGVEMTQDEARKVLEAAVAHGENARVYGLAHNQIVTLSTPDALDKFSGSLVLVWQSKATANDLVSRAALDALLAFHLNDYGNAQQARPSGKSVEDKPQEGDVRMSLGDYPMPWLDHKGEAPHIHHNQSRVSTVTRPTAVAMLKASAADDWAQVQQAATDAFGGDRGSLARAVGWYASLERDDPDSGLSSSDINYYIYDLYKAWNSAKQQGYRVGEFKDYVNEEIRNLSPGGDPVYTAARRPLGAAPTSAVQALLNSQSGFFHTTDAPEGKHVYHGGDDEPHPDKGYDDRWPAQHKVYPPGHFDPAHPNNGTEGEHIPEEQRASGWGKSSAFFKHPQAEPQPPHPDANYNNELRRIRTQDKVERDDTEVQKQRSEDYYRQHPDEQKPERIGSRQAERVMYPCHSCGRAMPFYDDKGTECPYCGLKYNAKGVPDHNTPKKRRQSAVQALLRSEAVNESGYGYERYISDLPQPTKPAWVTEWSDEDTRASKTDTERGRAGYDPAETDNPLAKSLTTVRQAALKIAENETGYTPDFDAKDPDDTDVAAGGQSQTGTGLSTPTTVEDEFGEADATNAATGQPAPDADTGKQQAVTTKPRQVPDGAEKSNVVTIETEVAPGQMGGGGGFDMGYSAQMPDAAGDPSVPTVDQMVAAKVNRITSRILLDNPTMARVEAKRLAALTVAKHPEMVKVAGDPASATCPGCGKENVRVTNGKIAAHKDPNGNRCEGSGRSVGLR